MGKKKALLPLSLVLSGLSAVLNIIPFVLVWYITRDILSAPQAINVSTVGTYAWLAFASAIAGVVVYFCALMSSHLAAFRVEVGCRKSACRRLCPCRWAFLINIQAAKCEKSLMMEREQPTLFWHTSCRIWRAPSFLPLF